ncbi:type II toxin-antitoxin system TacA family antitoxin [Sphingobacterium luzhongxinii]|uniref:type II toxin-antitoxin system TacA family antitoxin n=1 Tax=Sphingobacterium luzhongxinii TaxID=2654181 RepID=UPI0013D939E2|nr:DUF1778 domain-containing protein [Sphingobacterium sp. xlx-73]
MATLVNDRIDVRISKEHKDLIKYASELSGFKSVSEFIVNVVSRESKKIIQEDSKILKSLEDKKIFVNAILNPPEPNEYLKSSLESYSKFVNSKEHDFSKFRKGS